MYEVLLLFLTDQKSIIYSINILYIFIYLVNSTLGNPENPRGTWTDLEEFSRNAKEQEPCKLAAPLGALTLRSPK